MQKGTFLLITLLSALVSCTGKLDENSFTKLFVEKINELNPEIMINETKPLEVHYSLRPTGNQNTAFLDNAYRNYLNGDDLNLLIEKYARSTVESIVDVPLDISRIVPVVKDVDYIKDISKSLNQPTADSSSFPFYYIPYGDGFIIMYALDTETNIRFLNATEVDELGLEEPQLREKAIVNLQAILPELQLYGENGLYMLTADGNYESSLILFNHIWEELKGKVDGNLVIAIPSRDVLLVTGTKNKEGIVVLKQKVEEVFSAGSYTLTRNLFVLQDDKWFIYKE